MRFAVFWRISVRFSDPPYAPLTEGFLRYRFGGAYIWRGLYMEGLYIFGVLW